MVSRYNTVVFEPVTPGTQGGSCTTLPLKYLTKVTIYVGVESHRRNLEVEKLNQKFQQKVEHDKCSQKDAFVYLIERESYRMMMEFTYSKNPVFISPEVLN